MGELIQYDFFKTKEESEIEAMQQEVAVCIEMSHKTRKALFARHGDLTKKYMEIAARLDILERNICNGK
jgi:hypothetical protein